MAAGPHAGSTLYRYHNVLFPITGYVCELIPDAQRDSTRVELYYEGAARIFACAARQRCVCRCTDFALHAQRHQSASRAHAGKKAQKLAAYKAVHNMLAVDQYSFRSGYHCLTRACLPRRPGQAAAGGGGPHLRVAHGEGRLLLDPPQPGTKGRA